MKQIEKLTLLHSNDMHGDFLAEEKEGYHEGGVSLLSGYIKQVREEEPNTLFAIAGDMFRGSIIDSEYRGLSTIELMNFLSPDVVTVGNHEVDYGLSHLLFLEKCAKFPIVNANMYIKTNHTRLFKPYEIIDVNGLKVMFIGIITEEVLASTRSEEVIGSFVDVWEAARQVGVIIDNYKTTRIDLTVLLTHIGFEEDQKLASLLDPNWGVDLIIGGHTHTLLNEPCVVNGVPIVQVGIGTDQIGRFDIDIDTVQHKMVNYTWKCVPINTNTCKTDTVLEEVLESYKKETDRKYNRIITNFKRTLTHPRRNMETELGNLFADLLQVDSSFDIMLYASGSIRLKEMGPIVQYQDLKECLPFNAPVYMLEISGKQFRHMMKYMLRDEALDGDGHTEFYQVSKGVRMVYSRSKHDFDEFSYNGKKIVDNQMLKVAIQDYHFKNFTEFFDLPIEQVLANKKARMVITDDFSIFEELLVGMNNVDAQVEGRITITE
ncbi:MAG: 5'-nucleotidase C-terminal domain-containing protein [Erysipelotrichaceae bacterium]|nr:5'-nucleotidase C-terminal domain-containing protein [Erysipelotrichaceae bacterium]